MGEQDNMVTMHDLLDAQWMYDNTKVGGFGSSSADRGKAATAYHRGKADGTSICRR
jgi:hypothetical protein